MENQEFPHPAKMYRDEASKWAVTELEKLPTFSSGLMTNDPAAHCWVRYMIYMHGPDAPFFALKAITAAIEALDYQVRRGLGMHRRCHR
jgi:hypothetical protein